MAKQRKTLDLLTEVENILSQYDIRVTIRQIYYRLVAKQLIENTIQQYHRVDCLITDARKDGTLDDSKIEDRTRGYDNKIEFNHNSIRTQLESNLNDVIEKIQYPSYRLDDNAYQPRITLVMLEKQALEGIFTAECDINTFLVVCRGFNSYSQLKSIAIKLKNETREIHCRIFSDFDPSGIAIQDNFVRQLQELGIQFASVRRVALTEEQVQAYNLPRAPVKPKDPRAVNWKEIGVVELDALDPPVLQKLLRECIDENWDFTLGREVQKLKAVLNQRYQKLWQKEIKIEPHAQIPIKIKISQSRLENYIK